MSEELSKPLYNQIQEYIAELILSGKLAPDAKIQSEREFSEELGVSRMTVRRAITELVNVGSIGAPAWFGDVCGPAQSDL